MSTPPKPSSEVPLRSSSPTRNARRQSFGTFDNPNANQQKPLILEAVKPSTGDDPSSAEVPGDTLNKKAARRRALILSLAGGCIVLVVTLIIGIAFLKRTHGPQKRNVIMMVSDGFGPASETFSRSYYQKMNNLTWSHQMPLDTILVGTSRTRSTSSLVTDSAAGATAFSCAIKSYNAAISVDDNRKPCGTVLEAAKAAGMLTGLVVTSRITHATPACFSAHVPHRDMENEIAQQQIGENPLGRQLDLMMGGGRCHFMQKAINGSCRSDDRDLMKEGEEAGWKFITSRKEFDSLDYNNPTLPLGALFTLDHMSYDIDRSPDVEPSLKEMTSAALSMLNSATKSGDKGFFIMIEGSRIDLAAHANDAASHVHDILAYQETIAYVKEFVDNNPGTVMISVSDHETGGFTLARQLTETYPEYRWHPEVIARVQASTEVLASRIIGYKGPPLELDNFLSETIFKEGLGIANPTLAELQKFAELRKSVAMKDIPEADKIEELSYLLFEPVNFRAELGWTTHGHSGVDVNLYAYGQGSEKLRGNHENTDIGDFVRNFLSLDTAAITERLNTPEFLQRLSENKEAVAHKEIMNDGLLHFHRVQTQRNRQDL